MLLSRQTNYHPFSCYLWNCVLRFYFNLNTYLRTRKWIDWFNSIVNWSIESSSWSKSYGYCLSQTITVLKRFCHFRWINVPFHWLWPGSAAPQFSLRDRLAFRISCNTVPPTTTPSTEDSAKNGIQTMASWQTLILSVAIITLRRDILLLPSKRRRTGWVLVLPWMQSAWSGLLIVYTWWRSSAGEISNSRGRPIPITSNQRRINHH